MLYMFELDGKIAVSSTDPDEDDVMEEFGWFELPDPRKLPLSTQMGILRNILTNGGSKVILR